MSDNNVGASTCVVCRGPCTRGRLTCRACYDKGHRPLEGKSDAEVIALVEINNRPHVSRKVKTPGQRREPHDLPLNYAELPFCFVAVLPENGRWYHCGTEVDRNTAYKLVKHLEKQGLTATQRKHGSDYLLFARKTRKAA